MSTFILGATGLVGSGVLKLLNHPHNQINYHINKKNPDFANSSSKLKLWKSQIHQNGQ